MINLIKQLLQTGCVLFLVCALAPAIAFGQVNVFAEGAYTETELDVCVYANTNGTELRSAGVKLTYEPSELTVTSAEKNESAWYLGSESYMDPETATAGEVVIILGKLDTSAPSEGVSGDRVLLGKVRFDRTESSMPFSPTLGIELGKVHPNHPTKQFTNFVDTGNPAAVLDGSVTFGEIIVHIKCRGDFNNDGVVDGLDFISFRNEWGKTGCNESTTDCLCDLNGDGTVDGLDFIIFRNNWGKICP